MSISVVSTYQRTVSKERHWSGGIELSIIHSMVVYENLFPMLKQKRQAHRAYRTMLIHELVQSLLDLKNSEIVWWQTTTHEKRLKRKHFPSNRHHQRKCCAVCAYTRNTKGKQSRKNTSNYCVKCDKFICKDCFENFHVKCNPKQ